MAKLFCQVAGILLLFLGVLGVVGFGIPGLLSIAEPAEIGVHFLTGALAVFAGFSAGDYGRWAVLYAKVGGAVYLLLGVVGFVMPDVVPGVFHFDLGCNLAHLVLGVWGAWAGFAAAEGQMETAQA